MHKTILSLTLFFLVLSLAGAGCGKKQEGGGPDGGLAQKAKDTFVSIRDAVDRSVALRCEYVDDDGTKTIAYIKGKQVRLDSEGTKGKGNMVVHGVIRDNKMWIWGDNADKGVLINFSKITDDSIKMGNQPVHSQDDIIARLEDKKDTCRTTTIADSEFALPAGLSFLGE